MTTPPATKPPAVRRRLVGIARLLTTPLLPDDYLTLINPLWSVNELRGRIEAVHAETADSATIVIRPGHDWAGHVAGQWLRIGVEIDGVRHWRTFSLSCEPKRRDGRITITVKAARDGFVSAYLVRRAGPGEIVWLEQAQGEFVLPPAPPGRILFLTAGSGITPVMSMLRDLAHRSDLAQDADLAQGADLTVRADRPGGSTGELPDMVVIHSAFTPEDVIFGDELRALAARLPSLRLYERHTDTDGLFKLSELDEVCPDWAERHTWACGPGPMLEDIEAHWAAVGRTDLLSVERFRPATVVSGGEGGRIRFTKSGVETEADGDTPLLVAGEEAGALLPSGCRMGICYSCVGTLTSGKVRDLRTGEIHGDEGECVQTCVSAAAGPVEIDL